MRVIYLHENIKALNEQYGKYGLRFEPKNRIIRLYEQKKFILQEYPEIKERFQVKLGLKYNKTVSWHIRGKDFESLKLLKIMEKISEPFEDLLQKLFNYINMVEEQSLKDSIKALLKKYSQFYIIPASKYYHHDYKHGLLEHTVEVIEISLFFYEKYKIKIQLCKDLVIAGALLHDIGKISCLDIDNEESIYSQDTEDLEGHIINGVSIVSLYIKSSMLKNIRHIVASHHRLLEWGSPVEPISYEAKIVHTADYLSSQLFGKNSYSLKK